MRARCAFRVFGRARERDGGSDRDVAEDDDADGDARKPRDER